MYVAPSQDVLITLDSGMAVSIRRSGENHPRAIVGNVNHELHLMQLDKGGEPSRSMEIVSPEKTRTSYMTHAGGKLHLILDEDGDGLPDRMIDGGKAYTRVGIEWQEVESQIIKETEP
ncbi:MAG TPA: hypothetical protein PKE12_15270 [Kiritimatiellia bacterium]|nr:hypothetical protein [Kiritimatiellia bacterium]